MHWLNGYLRAIGDIRRGGGDTEMSYRPALDAMLRAAAADVAAPDGGKFAILHEPQRGAGGAPDFRIDAAGGGIVGYVEHKKPGENLPRLIGGAQLRRYAALSPNILLTDGWRWLALRDGKQAGDVSLPQSDDGGAAGMRDAFAELLRAFFSAPADGIGDAKTLAARLATRCDILRRELARVVGDDSGRLKGLYDAFKRQIYHDMEEAEFADAFAQTTTYSLLMAKLRAGAGAALDLYSAKKHIPQSFALIRELSGFLSDLEDETHSQLRWVVGDILALVNNMDVAAIAETISRAQTAGMDDDDDPFAYFYEDFLAAYDSRLRKSRGVYYTPLPVVRFIVRAVDDILKNDFGMEEGLADKEVTSLDFAAGTGAFMQETMRRALNGKSAAKRRLLTRDRLLPNCHGFEYMIAPYVIAHLKLSRFLEDQGCGIDEGGRDKALKIILTNALEGASEQEASLFLPALGREAAMAGEVKESPILAIMGNPPYSGNSQTASKRISDRAHKTVKGKRVKAAQDTWIGGLLKTYHCGADGKRLEEINGGWLQNDYVKFVRFAQHKMEGIDRGVVAIITDHGFLDNPTFRGMRQSLLGVFDRLYFLDLHGNSRRRETAPDGGKDENVFDIQTGVCISLFVKNPALSRGVFHCDVFGDRKRKHDFCLSHSVADVKWKALRPDAPFYPFAPYNKTAARQFQSYPSLRDIFSANCVGIVTGRDKLTVAFDPEEMRRRAREFADMPPEEARARYALGPDARWNLAAAQRDLRDSGLRDANFRQILFRPFDKRCTYYTGESEGFHHQPRREVMSHMLDVAGNVGLCAPRRQEIRGEWRHAFVADALAQHHSATRREVSYIFPMWRRQEGMEGAGKAENIAPAFRKWLDDRYQRRFSVEEVMAHVYAVLHSPDYRRRYADALRMDFPRIPFPPTAEEFERLAGIGKRLIGAHLLRDELSALSADLHGDGEDAPIENPRHDREKLRVNGGAYFAPVPAAVFAFDIGGYRPLERYLKERQGRRLTLADVETIRKIAAAIAFTLEAMREIGRVD